MPSSRHGSAQLQLLLGDTVYCSTATPGNKEGWRFHRRKSKVRNIGLLEVNIELHLGPAILMVTCLVEISRAI